MLLSFLNETQGIIGPHFRLVQNLNLYIRIDSTEASNSTCNSLHWRLIGNRLVLDHRISEWDKNDPKETRF